MSPNFGHLYGSPYRIFTPDFINFWSAAFSVFLLRWTEHKNTQTGPRDVSLKALHKSKEISRPRRSSNRTLQPNFATCLEVCQIRKSSFKSLRCLPLKRGAHNCLFSAGFTTTLRLKSRISSEYSKQSQGRSQDFSLGGSKIRGRGQAEGPRAGEEFLGRKQPSVFLHFMDTIWLFLAF